MKKRNILILILTSILIITINISSYAVTDDYKKWQNLSDEEKYEVIEPTPFSVDLKDSIKRSRVNSIGNKLGESTIPSKYILTDDIKINVKNQGNTNSCWAFSITSLLETNLAKTKNINQIYSPRHIEYATSRTFLDGINTKGYKREAGGLGNPYIGLAYCVSGNGPVLEQDMPFENNENKIKLSEINKKVSKKVENYISIPSIYKKIENGKITYSNGESQIYTDKDVQTIRNLLKQQIRDNSAVTAVVYIASSKNWNTNNWSLYCSEYENIVPDHAVTIVGWDDNYSKDNFNSENKPINDGAYICLNSYGENVLNDGYIYVSYDDTYIEGEPFGIINIEDIDYDNLYQYDEYGYSRSLPLQNTETKKALESIYAENIFTKNTVPEGKVECLKEIGIYVSKASNIEIWGNLNTDNETSKMEKIASPGILEAGYHNIELPTPIEITGNKFSVCAKYENTEGIEIPLEFNFASNGYSSNYWDYAKSEKGQTLISINGNTWQDLTELVKDSNVCIKAYTIYKEKTASIAVTGISLNKNSLTIIEGDESNLVATITPTNATNQNVIWKSSDEKVLTVNSKGIIKAISAGTANITVTSDDGNKTATCTVNVTKKTNNDDDMYKTKEDYNGTEQIEEVKEKENENINNEKTIITDDTTAKQNLPNTGIKTALIVITLVIITIGIYAFIGYKKLKLK